ncbi:MAG: type IV toxin-antitoxin system AbiEi family antitoxin domain-containing protein [Thermoleophilia bacterium]
MQNHDQDRWETLGRAAESQAGYFTVRQAEEAGFHRSGLMQHSREGGRLQHVSRGLYRLRFFPGSPFEHIAAAWVSAGPNLAVISHESALELFRLADVAPSDVHITLPRSFRHRRPPFGVRYHFPRVGLAVDEVQMAQGMRATSVERTLADVAEGTTQPEQVRLAIHQALERSVTTAPRLESAFANRSQRARLLLRESLST